MKFSLDTVETIKYIQWKAQHDATCPYFDDGTKPEAPSGAIGGTLTYMFTPTSIGCVARVKCACGEEVDLTNYKGW